MFSLASLRGLQAAKHLLALAFAPSHTNEQLPYGMLTILSLGPVQNTHSILNLGGILCPC